jgi:hypothetical protein
MKQWMEYVYMQQDKPTTTAGVPINVAVIDSNGNYRNVGNTASDSSGAYSLQWTPDITGKYTVIATFAGSNAYYGSSAETSFAVDQAPATPAPTQTQILSASDAYLLPGIISIIVAIAVVGIVLALLAQRSDHK